jgi:preprotein translocase subunit YajC
MAPSGSGGGEAGGFASFVPLLLMFAVFYFLLIRPQQKRAKELKNMLAALKRGDEVLTSGGIYGRILETADDYVILDVGEIKMKIARSNVTAVIGQSKVEPIKKTKKGAEGKGKADKKTVKNVEALPAAPVEVAEAAEDQVLEDEEIPEGQDETSTSENDTEASAQTQADDEKKEAGETGASQDK